MYRPSESFRAWSNKKAQKKAGTYVDALTFYAKRAKELKKVREVLKGGGE